MWARWRWMYSPRAHSQQERFNRTSRWPRRSSRPEAAYLLQPPAVQPYFSDDSAEGTPRLENLGFQLPYRLLKTGNFVK
jgi:hypothetical protein